MYNPGGDYLTYIKDSIIRKPRSKIVVDGKTYTGLEHLVSFPKITHETEKIIGGFPAKTCEFEIYNLDGKLSLNGKEVQVYRGLDISDTKTVWVPMGLFYADGEDVTNNSTKRTIQFKGTDRTRLFDSPFANVYGNGIIPADTVISTVAEKICAKHGLTINTATKANIISYRFTEAVGTPESTTDRQMISWIAELSGCIPIISRDGKTLLFTRPTYKETVTESGKAYPSGSYADKRKYKTLSAEPLYGPINSVSFGHADYDDAYVYQDDTDVQANGLHEWQINDNPLVENNKAALAPKVFAIIKGMKLYPFELTEFIDDYLFDINDGIQIKKKDGTHITSYVLGMSTTSRIRSTFKAGTQDSSAADRNLAGSVKADLKSVKLSVDHINNQITALVKETDEKYSKLTQTVDGFETEIANTKSGLEAKITATAEKAELTYAKKETVDGITDQIATINTELEGIDGKIEGKVTTEVQKDTTISILAGKVESKIGGNYVTKATYDDEKQNWLLKTTYDSYVSQTDQKISAAVRGVQKLEDAGYITESQCSSLISAQADNIALSVESNLKYESRNLLLDSECFEHLTPTGYHATYEIDYVAKEQSYLPSAKARKLTFTADGTVAGVQFKAADTVGDKDKIKPNTTYALSFWARIYSENATQSLHWQEAIYTALAPNVPSYDDKRTRGFKLSSSWQKVVIVFTTPGVIDTFTLRFALEGCVANQTYAIGISSIKLEVGNVATPWTARTPSAEEVEQYAKAQISMCVQKDENNNLVSEINIASNKLTINTDNFTLAKDGTMTCSGAKITNGSIKCGEGDTSMEILNGLIMQRELGQPIGSIYSVLDRNGHLAEAIMGTNSVSIISGMSLEATGSSGEVAQFDFLPDGTLQNGEGWKSATPHGTDTFSAFKHFRVFTDTNGDLSNVLMASVGIHTDKGLGVELYDTKNGQVECAVKIRRNDNAVVSIYGIRGGSTSPALTLGNSDGNLYYNGKKLAFTSEGVTAFPDAVGATSSTSYVYVVADKNTGKIGFLSA